MDINRNGQHSHAAAEMLGIAEDIRAVYGYDNPDQLAKPYSPELNMQNREAKAPKDINIYRLETRAGPRKAGQFHSIQDLSAEALLLPPLPSAGPSSNCIVSGLNWGPPCPV